jgi:hypothetical protein
MFSTAPTPILRLTASLGDTARKRFLGPTPMALMATWEITVKCRNGSRFVSDVSYRHASRPAGSNSLGRLTKVNPWSRIGARPAFGASWYPSPPNPGSNRGSARSHPRKVENTAPPIDARQRLSLKSHARSTTGQTLGKCNLAPG